MPQTPIQRRTVGIVGTGNVGVAGAYALFIQNLASELVLVDIDERRAEGEAMDLMHGQMLAGKATVRAGGYEDLAGAQVVIITAGASQSSSGESRLDLLQRNADIFGEIVAQLDDHAPEAILLVATNPVDVLTYVTQEISRRPDEHILGTGTLLDTARFRALLGDYYGVDPRSVHAYILGEHGDSEVPVWSHAYIGGRPILDQNVLGKPFDRPHMMDLFEQARRAAYEIIERKGHTDTAIGVVISRLVRAILHDERAVVPVSTRLHGEYGITDVCLSLPCVVGSEGVVRRVRPQLSRDELLGLKSSASVLRETLEKVQLSSKSAS